MVRVPSQREASGEVCGATPAAVMRRPGGSVCAMEEGRQMLRQSGGLVMVQHVAAR